MAQTGWKQLLKGWPWFRGRGRYPIAAYSEFLPPPRRCRKPYGDLELLPFAADDPWGWHVTEYEQRLELQPGLEKIAQQVGNALEDLGSGRPARGLPRAKVVGNPCWPEALAQHAGKLAHERYVLLLPLALAQTQDDKGRIRWTFFGSSEQGPAKAFWRGFFTAPDREVPEKQALDFFRRLLHLAYGEPEARLADLRRAGFRILPMLHDPEFPHWSEGPLAGWTKSLLLGKGASLHGVKYLLTFRPFDQLPPAVQRAYLAGELHLLPFPGSLLFWSTQVFRRMDRELPLAQQIPLQHLVSRNEGWQGLRVPQSGWLYDGAEGPGVEDVHGPVRNTFKRTHRWGRIQRYEDELAKVDVEDKVMHVLFSVRGDHLGLYGKPMARNSQMCTHEFLPLLDGPRATAAELERALRAVNKGGWFGYRFQYPAMRVGRHEVYWHRPLLAYRNFHSGQFTVLPEGPLGYMTAYNAERPDPAQAIELWPRLLQRPEHVAALQVLEHPDTYYPFQTALNIRKLLDVRHLLGDEPLTRSMARALLTANKKETVDTWLDKLKSLVANDEQRRMIEAYRDGLDPEPAVLPEPLTYAKTATRAFEVAYWKTIAFLAEGKYLTKNNADCVSDAATQKHLKHHHRDLDRLGDYVLEHYRKLVSRMRMTGKALVGELPFQWRTEFPYEWMGGWLNNQMGESHERDLILVIPGRDRSRAVIMADHYDTAYMADSYDPKYGGDGARLAAAGADDNHSATVALMLGAPLFLELSKAKKLACDIWLVHLTGEEFPADCLGARHLCEEVVQGTLRMRGIDGKEHNLSKTRVQGLYVLDMVAHNNDRDRDTFQMAPGIGAASMWLAYQAHLATEIWNAGTATWNRRATHRRRGRGRRSADGKTVPAMARHLPLYGEVRPNYDPRSTLYNTDGQIFSDAGVPVVLFMENYDINRQGYHDQFDTMANIDLDYGSAVAAIAIESVARAATETPP